MLRFERRQFLQAMGLGGLALSAGALGLPGAARAGGGAPPRRVLFFISPHGTVWRRWKFAIPGAPDADPRTAATVSGSRAITGLAEGDWPELLRPLRRHAGKLQVVEGLSQITTYAEERDAPDSADLNRHHLAQAHLLTCNGGFHRPGSSVIGGHVSVDQHMGQATRGSRPWGVRVYGNNHQHPYSFVGPGEEGARVSEPLEAFGDVMGAYTPPTTMPDPPPAPMPMPMPMPMDPPPPPAPSRADLIRRARGSVLDLVAAQYAAVAPRLGRDDRLKLERHQALIRDLERSFAGAGMAGGGMTGGGMTGGGMTGSGMTGGGPMFRAACDPVPPTATCDASLHACVAGDPNSCNASTRSDELAQVASLALSCDLTRVVTLIAPNMWTAGEFGLPCEHDVHQNYAHNSIPGDGATFTTEAENGMIAFNLHYARRFAYLLDVLDSIPEGDGTLLDHTTVVWLTELATGTHEIVDCPVVMAGGAGHFGQGRYVRVASPTAFTPRWGAPNYLGGSLSRLYVALMQYLGMPDDSFGMRSVSMPGGASISLTGPQPELR